MSYAYSVTKSVFLLSISAIAACGGSTSNPTPDETYTADIQVDVLDNGVEIRAPAVFFEGEPTQIGFSSSPFTIFLESENLLTNNSLITAEIQVVPQLTGTGDSEQLNSRIIFDIAKESQQELQGWSRPVYQYPIELGDPLTLKSGGDLTLSANLSEAFLDSEKDAFDSFEWEQLEGPNIGPLDADKAKLSLTLPDVTEITRLRFQLTAKTIKDKIFRKEKVVFVVPDEAWVSVTHFDQGAQNTVVARDDGSIVHFSPIGEVRYSDSPFTYLKQLEDGTPLWALAENGELKWFNVDRAWQSPLQDLPAMSKVFGIFGDARWGTQMIDETGNAYLVWPSDHSLSMHSTQAVSVSHRLLSQHTLFESGELKDSAGELVSDGIAEISQNAFRSLDGRIGVYSNEGALHYLSEFDQHSDIVMIASPKHVSANFPPTVFAVRENGDIVGSTPKAPPAPRDLVNIRKVEVGQKVATALNEDGTVIQWRVAILKPDETNEVLRGEKPSPFNIKKNFY